MATEKPKIPAAVVVGMVFGTCSLLIGATLEGSPLLAFLNLPAVFFIFGGTTGALLTAVGGERFMWIFSGFKEAFRAAPPAWEETALELLEASEMAARDGLLSLEDRAKAVEDPFLARAYQGIADAIDLETLEGLLTTAIETESKQTVARGEVFTTAGGFAPTMGIIGTVMGLVHALGLLGEPDKLGPAIAAAFMATLYGVASANLFWLPVGNRLFILAREREAYREMMLTAALAIYSGTKPRGVADLIAAMLPTQTTGDELYERLRNRDRQGG